MNIKERIHNREKLKETLTTALDKVNASFIDARSFILHPSMMELFANRIQTYSDKQYLLSFMGLLSGKTTCTPEEFMRYMDYMIRRYFTAGALYATENPGVKDCFRPYSEQIINDINNEIQKLETEESFKIPKENTR